MRPGGNPGRVGAVPYWEPRTPGGNPGALRGCKVGLAAPVRSGPSGYLEERLRNSQEHDRVAEVLYGEDCLVEPNRGGPGVAFNCPHHRLPAVLLSYDAYKTLQRCVGYKNEAEKL